MADCDNDQTSLWPTEDDGFAASLIRRKARRLIAKAGLPPTEQPELEQHLTVQLWRSIRSFDPQAGGWPGYASTVVSRAGTKVLRRQFAEKRDSRRTQSLNVSISAVAEQPTERAQAVSEDDFDRRLGRVRSPREALADLTVDLTAITVDLPPLWRTMLQLRATKSMQQVSEEMGIPRTTLNEWMSKVRRRLESAGMQKYLEN